MKLIRDNRNKDIQVSYIGRVETISAGGTFTPGLDDTVFLATADSACVVTSAVNGVQASITLPEWKEFGIPAGDTFTFASETTLVVM